MSEDEENPGSEYMGYIWENQDYPPKGLLSETELKELDLTSNFPL